MEKENKKSSPRTSVHLKSTPARMHKSEDISSYVMRVFNPVLCFSTEVDQQKIFNYFILEYHLKCDSFYDSQPTIISLNSNVATKFNVK